MKTVNYLVLMVASVLAFFSFAISYEALKNLAAGEGINPSSLFPLIIDGVIILALIWRLYGNCRDESRIIMGIYVILSIALNAVSHGSILGAIMAAVAPISLFVCSEVAASMLHMKEKKGPARDEKGRFIKSTEV